MFQNNTIKSFVDKNLFKKLCVTCLKSIQGNEKKNTNEFNSKWKPTTTYIDAETGRRPPLNDVMPDRSQTRLK